MSDWIDSFGQEREENQNLARLAQEKQIKDRALFGNFCQEFMTKVSLDCGQVNEKLFQNIQRIHTEPFSTGSGNGFLLIYKNFAYLVSYLPYQLEVIADLSKRTDNSFDTISTITISVSNGDLHMRFSSEKGTAATDLAAVSQTLIKNLVLVADKESA